MSIGLGMDISIRGDGEATTKDVPVTDSGFSRHNSLSQFDPEKEHDPDPDRRANGNGKCTVFHFVVITQKIQNVGHSSCSPRGRRIFNILVCKIGIMTKNLILV